jgi:hypothetical protein
LTRRDATVAATALAGLAGTIGVTAVHDSGTATNASSSTDTSAVAAGGKVETAASSTQGGVPVSYGVSAEVREALLRQGIRVDSAGEPGSATTDPAALFSGTADGAGADVALPEQVSLARIADLQYGQVVDADGNPVADPGPQSGGQVEPRINDRLVWLAIFPHAEVPVGGSPVTGIGPDGQPVTTDSPDVQMATMDLYVVRDALTGAFLEAGSLD